MQTWLNEWFPYVMKKPDQFLQSIEETLIMIAWAGGLMLLFGLFFGIVLTVTREGGIMECKIVYHILDKVINLFRSIPFVILIAVLMNLTKWLMGTRIGVRGVIVPLVFGSVPFFAELAKRIDLDVEYDFMDVSSYVGRHSGGEIRILKDLDTSVRDRDVLLVEDIVDTGKTIQAVIELLYHRGARSVKIVTLLDKPSGRTNHLHADYIGFEVGNEFVVGFGMDFNQKYRTLPFIGVLKPECYESKE